MNMTKMLEVNELLKDHAYDLEFNEFLAVIGTAVDEYCAYHGLDTNDTWETLNGVRKEIFDMFGGATYMDKKEV
ncbi:MAG: hypothetical protein II013_05635 [Lachnobacterium sp.]|nr:hypothetical protein [Lachnobacterium sp.]